MGTGLYDREYVNYLGKKKVEIIERLIRKRDKLNNIIKSLKDPIFTYHIPVKDNKFYRFNFKLYFKNKVRIKFIKDE